MNLRERYLQRGIAGIALALVLAWLIFLTDYLPFSPMRTGKELGLLRQELQSVAGELQRAREVAASIPRVERELAQLESKWEALRSLLPKATEMSGLLAEVTDSGMRAGTQFTLFEPLAPELFELYTKYPIRVSVTGGYHDVGDFFDNICNMSRLVGVSEVKVVQLTESKRKEEAAKDVTVEATATIAAFTYNEEPRKIERPVDTKTTQKKSQTGK